jgi:hypothetical protein
MLHGDTTVIIDSPSAYYQTYKDACLTDHHRQGGKRPPRSFWKLFRRGRDCKKKATPEWTALRIASKRQ